MTEGVIFFMDKPGVVIRFFQEYPGTLVLLSGGVDSAVLALLACRGTGGTTRALSFRTPLVKKSETAMALEVASFLGIECHVHDVDVISDPRVRANCRDRCFGCRKILHAEAKKFALSGGFSGIADGVQADEIHEPRPGLIAAEEDGIIHPLADAGLTKKEIREIAREAGLPNSERPAAPCLATRFPPDIPLSAGWAEKIEAGEEILAAEGFSNSRIRWFPPGAASIEIDEKDIPSFWEKRNRICASIRDTGFPVVSLDLEGLQRGKMERFLEVKKNACR